MVRLKQIKNDRNEKYQILRKRQFTKMVHILTTQKLDYTKKYIYMKRKFSTTLKRIYRLDYN